MNSSVNAQKWFPSLRTARKENQVICSRNSRRNHQKWSGKFGSRSYKAPWKFPCLSFHPGHVVTHTHNFSTGGWTDGRMLGLSFFSLYPPLRVVATTRWFCYAHIHCRAGKPQISDLRKLTLFRERLSQKRREEFNDAWKSRFCSVWFELEVESENCQKKVRRPRWTWSGHIAIIIFARFVSRAVRTLSPLLTLKRKGLRRLLWPCRFLKDMTGRKSVKNHKFVCSTSSIFALAWAVSTSTAICFLRPLARVITISFLRWKIEINLDFESLEQWGWSTAYSKGHLSGRDMWGQSLIQFVGRNRFSWSNWGREINSHGFFFEKFEESANMTGHTKSPWRTLRWA